MSDKYIINDAGDVEACDDLLVWGRWLQNAGTKRHVAQDYLDGGVNVSTVFLGLDHSFGVGKPVLWETMIFGGKHDEYQERYTSRDEAIAGHAKALKLAKGETE